MLCAVAFASSAYAGLDTVVFNATTNGVGDDPAGQGTNFTTSSPLFGIDQIQEAFGQNSGPIEPGDFMFADGGVADNGNNVMGDGGETIDYVRWQTTSPVILQGYSVALGSEGPSQGYNRGTQLFTFGVAGEQDDFFDDNAQNGWGSLNRTFPVAQIGKDFEIKLTRHNGSGPRLCEVDAIVPDAMSSIMSVDQNLFNAVTNGYGDEAAGLSYNFASSASIPGDTIEDVFGNNNGGIEPSSFIFSDAGTADNRDNTFDAGTETIDFISWSTASNVQIWGYQIEIAADGDTEYRGTELVRFYVEDTLVDVIDLNHYSGAVNRLFGAGQLSGNDFRIEITRTVANGGSRIFEVNAIVPEPLSLAMFGLAGLGFLTRRSR